ncbi:metal-dependent transcriptional regulator [Haladaptatus sp. DYF46]|uniref:metal-dependent transcriptional regulator n=1 Tax=Haladaptatus sp. DYF46 TaxID=2886041 RepID=UPI001E284416|nr:metal-dependent transcriptional regulator [Haladaptatus sp. DYF46]
MKGTTQYLLALYILAHREDPPISPGAVAELLDKSPASITGMFQRLDDEGLISYEPYEGATLTETGRERAATLHESYVTVSWFFREVLDLDAHEEEAMELAGFLSPTVAERLAATLPCETEFESPSQSPSTTEDES